MRMMAPVPLLAVLALLGVVSVSGCRGESAAAPPEKPARICSVCLAGDEILADLVPPERVVAVTRYVDDARLSNVGGHYPPAVMRIRDAELEIVVALEPDLVLLSPYNDADFLELIRVTKLACLTIAAHASLADVMTSYIAVGDAVGEPQRARVVVEWMKAGLAELDEALAGVEERPRVLFWAGGYTAGPETVVDEMIARAGGTNVAAELGIEGSVEVDSERVVAANPTYFLRSRWDVTEEAGYTDFPAAFTGLDALRDGRVIELDGRLLDVLSAHLVEGAWRLAKELHPDRIDDEALARIAQGPPAR